LILLCLVFLVNQSLLLTPDQLHQLDPVYQWNRLLLLYLVFLLHLLHP
jgi:hypothetical protein